MRGLADILSDSSGFCQAVQAQDIRQAASIAARLVATTSHSNSPRHKTPEVPYSSDPGDVYGLQEDMLALEEVIPWACVRKIWKNKRSSWRREVRQTSSICGFARLVKELRHAQLMTGDVNFVHSEQFTLKNAWKTQLESCIAGTGRAPVLDGVWLEFKSNVHAWLASMSAEAQQERMMMVSMQSSGFGTSDIVGGAARDTVAPILIVRAMERHEGNLLHFPVESMLGACPSVRLAALRDVLMKKKGGNEQGGGDGKEGKDGKGGSERNETEEVGMDIGPDDSFDSGVSTDDEALTDVDDVFDLLV